MSLQALSFQALSIKALSQAFLRAISPRRLTLALSVRARIIAITLIPMIGFLANGAAYVSGEQDVDHALDSVKQATSFADASRLADVQAA
jgi:hypothetical protein